VTYYKAADNKGTTKEIEDGLYLGLEDANTGSDDALLEYRAKSFQMGRNEAQNLLAKRLRSFQLSLKGKSKEEYLSLSDKLANRRLLLGGGGSGTLRFKGHDGNTVNARDGERREDVHQTGLDAENGRLVQARDVYKTIDRRQAAQNLGGNAAH